MIAVVTADAAGRGQVVDAPLVVAERLEAFGVEVLAGAIDQAGAGSQQQVVCGGYRAGTRSSLEPLVDRVEEEHEAVVDAAVSGR